MFGCGKMLGGWGAWFVFGPHCTVDTGATRGGIGTLVGRVELCTGWNPNPPVPKGFSSEVGGWPVFLYSPSRYHWYSLPKGWGFRNCSAPAGMLGSRLWLSCPKLRFSLMAALAICCNRLVREGWASNLRQAYIQAASPFAESTEFCGIGMQPAEGELLSLELVLSNEVGCPPGASMITLALSRGFAPLD